MTLLSGRAPDVLVLGVGGLLGEAWMTGVLAGVEQATGHDMTACRAYVGSSAGSIVAASLAAGRSPRRPGRTLEGRREEAAAPARAARAFAGVSGAAGALGALVAPVGLAAAAPAGARLRGLVLSRVPDGRQSLDGLRADVNTWGASFDGRLRVCAVDRDNGRRVVFGSRSAPRAAVGTRSPRPARFPAGSPRSASPGATTSTGARGRRSTRMRRPRAAATTSSSSSPPPRSCAERCGPRVPWRRSRCVAEARACRSSPRTARPPSSCAG
jgi:hypothetical protein